MTKKLEELFNLPSSNLIDGPETAEEAMEQASEAHDLCVAADEAIDKIDAALPTVRDLDASDKEMDDLAKLAQDTFTDLINLSMNVEPRYSGTIIQSASTLLGHAITAKMAKMDKKLKMVDLQLKKAKLDQTAKPGDGAVEAQGTVIDRNELLKQILANSTAEK
jgi:hypothetical protein